MARKPLFTNSDKRKECERELHMRQAVYPGMVDSKKLSAEMAKRRIALMQDMLEDYREREAQDRAERELPL